MLSIIMSLEYLSTTGNQIREFEMLIASVGIDIFNQNQFRKRKNKKVFHQLLIYDTLIICFKNDQIHIFQENFISLCFKYNRYLKMHILLFLSIDLADVWFGIKSITKCLCFPIVGYFRLQRQIHIEAI